MLEITIVADIFNSITSPVNVELIAQLGVVEANPRQTKVPFNANASRKPFVLEFGMNEDH
jgi:hypothetical protein